MSENRVHILDVTGRVPEARDAFRAVAGRAYPFFLDSALCMPRIGRFSFLGCDPFLVMTATGRDITLRDSRETRREEENPFTCLRALLERWPVSPHPDVPFLGGAVGYLGYDLGHFIERLPCTTLNDIRMPDLAMAFHDTALVYDHAAERAWVVAADLGLEGRPAPEVRAEAFLDALRPPPPPSPESTEERAEILCNFTREEYLRAVQRAKDYIAEGDIFQVNLSRRFETALRLPPHELYLKLRRINPAPMAAFLAFDNCAVVSASPERFLKVRNGHVETRPIKGTRPRGKNKTEDEALAAELLNSEKDNAELAMIVDLERNDLGRVCSYGTVKVAEPRVLESFPTVHHLTATVAGDLHDGLSAVDLLRAAFPGGSITGAPKIRAMEIIDELEPTRRALYTGAIGYLGFDGGMDTSIVIRTLLVKDGRVYFQVGGGIVADSELVSEFDETSHKARALLDAVGGEGQGTT